jgi:uncharacterized damage-inducible protein DinB
MKAHYSMFAGYNRWANERLYEAASRLDEGSYCADRGAFFKSVHGTLNHLLAADRIWMQRFTGSGDAPDRLDAILCATLPALRLARRVEDERITGFIEALGEADFARQISYRPLTNPGSVTQDLARALDHFFTHQTHHRGQVHCLLTGLAGAAPSLDLLVFQRKAGIGMVGT